MPRIRPIGRTGGSPRATVRSVAATVHPGRGRAADLDRRDLELDPDVVLPVLRTRPITDGSGWHFSVYDANDSKTELARLAYAPSADPGGDWRWAVKHGPSGWAASRAEAMAELAWNLRR